MTWDQVVLQLKCAGGLFGSAGARPPAMRTLGAVAHLFSRVLVGWDGSSASAAGLRIACALAAANDGSVTALAVVPAFSHVEDAVDREGAIAAFRRPIEAEYERVLASITVRTGQRVALRFVEDSKVAEALDHYAAAQAIDLLIVGLHGREGALHPKMGHIANHVVRESGCPVLVVPDDSSRSTIRLNEGSAGFDGIRGLFHSHRHAPEPLDSDRLR